MKKKLSLAFALSLLSSAAFADTISLQCSTGAEGLHASSVSREGHLFLDSMMNASSVVFSDSIDMVDGHHVGHKYYTQGANDHYYMKAYYHGSEAPVQTGEAASVEVLASTHLIQVSDAEVDEIVTKIFRATDVRTYVAAERDFTVELKHHSFGAGKHIRIPAGARGGYVFFDGAPHFEFTHQKVKGDHSKSHALAWGHWRGYGCAWATQVERVEKTVTTTTDVVETETTRTFLPPAPVVVQFPDQNPVQQGKTPAQSKGAPEQVQVPAQQAQAPAQQAQVPAPSQDQVQNQAKK